MKYALLIYDDDSAWIDLPDDEKAALRAEEMPRWVALFEELGKADPNVSGKELDGRGTAKVVRVRRDELCDEAIRLGKLLAVLMPDEPEVFGLLALMLLQDSRRGARVGADGELVLLENQNRSLWDRHRIDEGLRMLERAVSLRRPGPYQLQAGVAAAHAEDRPWSEIVLLYDRLAEIDPSPVIQLNRAVAVALSGRVDEGLALLDEIEGLDGYHLLHAARGDLYRRLDMRDEAADSYRRALELTANEPETRYLERRLTEVS